MQLVSSHQRPEDFRDCIGYIQIAEKVKVWIAEEDSETFMNWNRDNSKIPLLFLEYLQKNHGDDMRLLKDKLEGINGACFIHEEISQDADPSF